MSALEKISAIIGESFADPEQRNEIVANVRRSVAPDADLNEGGRAHNWRTHVPDGLKAIWAELSEETRLAIWVVADEAATREHYH